jgi:hypothetical protein
MAATNQIKFNKFIGIDWSGAKKSNNLRVAICESGKSAPKLEGDGWDRDELVEWIIREVNSQPTLIGIDFAFAYPYLDKGAYFPGLAESPKSAFQLWSTIDKICHNDQHLYAGSFYKDRSTPFSDYFCYQDEARLRYDSSRFRETECKVCEEFNTRPSCVFKCVGPDQVGPGSAAGMRALNSIITTNSGNISIWPFESISRGKSVIVEIFPRIFFTYARENPQKWKDIKSVNAVLKYFNSGPLGFDFDPSSKYAEDKIDAIISSAALRELSLSSKIWQPKSLRSQSRQFEGWIFGCTL